MGVPISRHSTVKAFIAPPSRLRLPMMKYAADDRPVMDWLVGLSAWRRQVAKAAFLRSAAWGLDPSRC